MDLLPSRTVMSTNAISNFLLIACQRTKSKNGFAGPAFIYDPFLWSFQFSVRIFGSSFLIAYGSDIEGSSVR